MLSESRLSEPATDYEIGGEEGWVTLVEFRLTYDGPLPCESRDIKGVKHAIREHIHPQLSDLCARESVFATLSRRVQGLGLNNPGEKYRAGNLAEVGKKLQIGNFYFVPLVLSRLHMVCALDILFLRREKSGSLITKPKDEYGGDLDNRLKIFLDALRAPREASELPSTATPIARPFYCLLEDDALITKFQVEADTLLGDGTPETQKHVRLVVRVTTKITKSTFANLDFSFLG